MATIPQLSQLFYKFKRLSTRKFAFCFFWCENYFVMDQFSRTKLLIGDKNLEKLNNANILVFGLGGVGGGAV